MDNLCCGKHVCIHFILIEFYDIIYGDLNDKTCVMHISLWSCPRLDAEHLFFFQPGGSSCRPVF